MIQFCFTILGICMLVASIVLYKKITAGGLEMNVESVLPFIKLLGALGVVTIITTLVAIVSVCNQARILSSLYILFLVSLIICQYVSMSKTDVIAKKIGK